MREEIKFKREFILSRGYRRKQVYKIIYEDN
jgi:hypothetical protein